ncbi:MLP-like protein 43 isoform X1 [Mercurialis annua]|uniref:MLP-like protein 43 isoform X1 n=1 Tax=Mercurialis annua TaxID=3986 RepID=UPI0024AE25D3|nr:MLP-like protein 43 isoform X1 [Mercurialis annua]
MGLVGKLEGEVEIKAPAHLFHDVFSCRPHHVNIMSPDKVQSVDLHEGEWGKHGSTICWNYTHDGVAKVGKEIIEKIDDENLSTTFKVIEGDLLDEYKEFRFIVKATPKENGGSLVHWTLEYEKLHEGIPEPHSMLQFCLHTSKDICSHLSKNEVAQPEK